MESYLLLGIALLAFSASLLLLLMLKKRKRREAARQFMERIDDEPSQEEINDPAVLDQLLSNIKSQFQVHPRSHHPQVHFMGVQSTNISQLQIWLYFENKSRYPVRVNEVTLELWLGKFTKSTVLFQDIELKPAAPGQDFIFEQIMTTDDMKSFSQQAAIKQAECYLEGSVYCRTSVGNFEKKFAFFKLDYKVSNIIEEKGKKGSGMISLEDKKDSLTGMLQRGYLEENFQSLIDTTLPLHPVSFMMVDVDDFKQINDTYGHLVGDDVLKMICSYIHAAIENKGMPVRYGGDEFCVLLPCVDKDEAQLYAEKILKDIRAHKFKVSKSNEEGGAGLEAETHVPVSVSIGVATLKEKADYKVLMKKADEMLYLSKKGGKGKAMSDRRG